MNQPQERTRKVCSKKEAADQQQKSEEQAAGKKPFEAPRLEHFDEVARMTAMPTFNFS